MDKEVIQKSIEEARRTMTQGQGGPFGAAVIAPDGQVYIASNTVLGSHDPTAHAEVNAIRKACKARGTHDLSGCVLYATSYPCPMCLGAIVWANIKEIWYGCSAKDAADIGFRDDMIYSFIKSDCHDDQVLKTHQQGRELTIHLFEEYAKDKRRMY